MEEKEETKEEETKSTQLIDDANLAAKRLEEANTKQQELLSKQEELMARQRLGGNTEAGQNVEEKSEDEKKKEGAKEFFKGTQLEKDIEKS